MNCVVFAFFCEMKLCFFCVLFFCGMILFSVFFGVNRVFCGMCFFFVCVFFWYELCFFVFFWWYELCFLLCFFGGMNCVFCVFLVWIVFFLVFFCGMNCVVFCVFLWYELCFLLCFFGGMICASGNRKQIKQYFPLTNSRPNMLKTRMICFFGMDSGFCLCLFGCMNCVFFCVFLWYELCVFVSVFFVV